ncbi:MAG: UbiA prenyltransferase family protein, partial [Longimicrobiales bacterium]
MPTLKEPVATILARTPGAAPAALQSAASVRDWVRLVRPRQWVKNSFVLAPLLFAGVNTQPAGVAEALVAFVLFCLVASGVYCWNDVVDRITDRTHPTKRMRPVAAGTISPPAAAALGSALATVAVSAGFLLTPALGAVLLGYLGLNVLYALRLKSMVILDVFAIASFFVLRLLAGCAAIAVTPSVWLLLCGGLLSLYLGFAKRRHELLLLGGESRLHRSVLQQYNAGLLDQISGILLSVTVVA